MREEALGFCDVFGRVDSGMVMIFIELLLSRYEQPSRQILDGENERRGFTREFQR